MAKKVSGWLLGCALGCAGIALVGLIGASAAGFWVFQVFDDFQGAVVQRSELEERYGAVTDFTPPADGTVSHERMRTFLEIRHALEPYCSRFESTFGAFGRFETLEDQGHEPDAGDVLEVLRGAFGLAPLLGEFFAARNALLLENGMGLGEYTYIYVIAYRSWLGHAVEDADGVIAPRPIRSRVRLETAAILENQLRRLRTEPDPELDDLAPVLVAEIEALENEAGRAPWPDGLPAPLAATLEPWRDELESSYCPAATAFDLARNRRRGMAIHAD